MSSIKKQRAIYGILLVCWMTVIFVMSAQHAEQSAQLSGGLVTRIITALYPNFDGLSAAQQSDITYTATFIVRKAAHFSEYFILGALGILTANTFKKYKFAVRAAWALVFCILYAASDEIHQYFVPGRACRFTDILIDSAGILTAIILISALICRKRSGEQNA